MPDTRLQIIYLLFDLLLLISYTIFVQLFPYSLEYYVSGSGKIPFKDWLDGLRDLQTRARIRVRLDRIRLGNLGDTKHIADGVHEMRIDFGPGYRVYLGISGKTIILLLLGGDKTSQKKDIIRAKEYWTDFQRR